jgi:parallel beta-helix repeat protein
MVGGASRNRLRGNRLSGNGYADQGNNFGIGIEGTGTNDNVVENNTITGNTNGLYMTAGVQGNIIRRNLIVGNPPIQVDLDHPSAKGVDIKNQAQSGANTFQSNRCLTAVNAPCPAVKRQPEKKDK